MSFNQYTPPSSNSDDDEFLRSIGQQPATQNYNSNGFGATQNFNNVVNNTSQYNQPTNQVIQSQPHYSSPSNAPSAQWHTPTWGTDDPSELSQLGASFGFSFFKPFRGYGTNLSFNGNLIDDQAAIGTRLQDTFLRRIMARQIPDTKIFTRTFTAQGMYQETRSYVIIRRRGTTIPVLIAGLGKDLYISWRAYNRPLINYAAVVVFGLLFIMLGFLLDRAYYLPIISYSGQGIRWLVVPIVLTLVISLINVIVRGDPWAWLRGQPNTFQEDDFDALQRVVDQSLQECLEAVHINKNLYRLKETYANLSGKNSRVV